MKKIVAINCSPRATWNTATLVREAAKGAEEQGAEVEIIDLYKLEKFTGCVSCFGCKLPDNLGRCICKDGLAPVLEAIRNADGLIIGSPNYLGDVTAGFRALFERLIFQALTYKTEVRSYNQKQIPVLMIMTSNASEDFYAQIGYDQMLQRYQGSFNTFVGTTRILISSDTLQVKDYSRYNWTMFDPEAKKDRYEKVFPEDKKKAFALGEQMASGTWK
ncbi:MAG: flavodoxin family protein [Oscillospiraceae bacterium]|nr:flavodoxin family protein [Oscillospiraceae bacterium]MBQ7129995.1 flavodoxin family protein [Oscillospiraceae bacterium]